VLWHIGTVSAIGIEGALVRLLIFFFVLMMWLLMMKMAAQSLDLLLSIFSIAMTCVLHVL
jgi:hypothetical protein